MTSIEIITAVPPNNTHLYAFKVNGMGDYVPWNCDTCSNNASFPSTPANPNPLIIASTDRVSSISIWMDSDYYMCQI